MVEIVVADLTDPVHADALVTLLDCYALDPMGGGLGLSEYAKKNIAATLNRRDGSHVILAFCDNKPAGLLICFEGFSTFSCRPLLNIHDVVVVREYRGRGISSLLLHEAAVIAKRKDCCKMTLEVLEGNEAAMKSYTKFGFVNYQLDPEFGKAVFLEMKLD